MSWSEAKLNMEKGLYLPQPFTGEDLAMVNHWNYQGPSLRPRLYKPSAAIHPGTSWSERRRCCMMPLIKPLTRRTKRLIFRVFPHQGRSSFSRRPHPSNSETLGTSQNSRRTMLSWQSPIPALETCSCAYELIGALILCTKTWRRSLWSEKRRKLI